MRKESDNMKKCSRDELQGWRTRKCRLNWGTLSLSQSDRELGEQIFSDSGLLLGFIGLDSVPQT